MISYVWAWRVGVASALEMVFKKLETISMLHHSSEPVLELFWL